LGEELRKSRATGRERIVLTVVVGTSGPIMLDKNVELWVP
jgi:hypothetical protein